MIALAIVIPGMLMAIVDKVLYLDII